MKNIEEKIKNIVAKQLKVEQSKINDQSSLSDDFGADPLAILELTMSIEEKFKITITEKEEQKFNTIKDILNCVNKYLIV